jgi:hypothetical protein
MKGNGEFTGKIIAEAGDIAGWIITNNSIDKDSKVGMHSGEIMVPSLLNEGRDSPVRFYGGS